MRQYGNVYVHCLDIMKGPSIVLTGKIITGDELDIVLIGVLSSLIRSSANGLIATGCGDDAIRIYREVSTIESV